MNDVRLCQISGFMHLLVYVNFLESVDAVNNIDFQMLTCSWFVIPFTHCWI